MNNHYTNSCGCNTPAESARGNLSGNGCSSLRNPEKKLAMAYVPWQTWQDVMDGCNGLKHGSIFEELILPFEGTKAACSSQNRHDNRDSAYANNYSNRRGMR